MACESGGVFYSVDDDGPLADIMAGYFQVLAPMLEPCATRWVEYADWYTGETLLGACLASYEMLDGSTTASCTTTSRWRSPFRGASRRCRASCRRTAIASGRACARA